MIATYAKAKNKLNSRLSLQEAMATKLFNHLNSIPGQAWLLAHIDMDTCCQGGDLVGLISLNQGCILFCPQGIPNSLWRKAECCELSK